MEAEVAGFNDYSMGKIMILLEIFFISLYYISIQSIFKGDRSRWITIILSLN